MATIGAPLNIGQLPYTCYPSDPQSFYADMFSRASALYPQITGVIISDNTPAASDRDKLWIKTSGGAPIQPNSLFIYFGGAWVWPNPVVAGGNKRELWAGTLVQLQTYDGGDANPAGVASGPMWEEDTDFIGRSPLHPGLIPGMTASPVTLGVNGNAGAGEHTLVAAELPTHNHLMTWDRQDTAGGGQTNTLYDGSDNGAIVGDVTKNTGNVGSDTPHNNVHPVRGIYLIKRSSRVYYKGS